MVSLLLNFEWINARFNLTQSYRSTRKTWYLFRYSVINFDLGFRTTLLSYALESMLYFPWFYKLISKKFSIFKEQDIHLSYASNDMALTVEIINMKLFIEIFF